MASFQPFQKNELEPFRVMTWNVLASQYTHYSSQAHGGLPKSLESAAQQTSRHISIATRIISEIPDVVLLQEVDASFLPVDWQGGFLPCGVSLEGYTPYRSYSNSSRGVPEGVAILLRKDSWKRDQVLTL